MKRGITAMIKIITDTATLYTKQMASKLGIEVVPLSVCIENETYKEFEEISSEDIICKIKEGAMPTTSQPSIGDIIEAYEKYEGFDILHITLADGLSGTYQAAHTARELVENKDSIHILNSRTLCGPQQYLVDKALTLANQGMGVAQIIEELELIIKTEISFLIPQDFDFLKRGGRLTPIAATIGGLLHFIPILTTTEDSKRLEKYAVKRGFKSVLKCVIDSFKEHNVEETYQFYIAHGDAPDLAKEAKQAILTTFPNASIKILELSPCFLTQAGPGTITIQTIQS